ncbi:MAG: NADH dehydrogenase subunit, partial [Rikenellaceae bacterium]|nr:NADH dehydrogenase subunit [Rikenellaceae bacterium]
MEWLTTYNHEGSVRLDAVPVVSYPEFYDSLCRRLGERGCHIANYFGMADKGGVRFFCMLADDTAASVDIAS